MADQARHRARSSSTRYVGEATAVSLVSLNKKWYETDSYKDVREIDILEDKKAEDPTQPAAEPRPDAAGDPRASTATNGSSSSSTTTRT